MGVLEFSVMGVLEFSVMGVLEFLVEIDGCPGIRPLKGLVEIDGCPGILLLNDGWQEIDADKDYDVVVSDYLYGGGDGYEIPRRSSDSRPASEIKYLVLDAILRAQGLGQPVGESIDHDNRRLHQLLEGKEPCFR